MNKDCLYEYWRSLIHMSQTISVRYQPLRRVLGATIRWVWRRLPLSVSKKQKLKNYLFGRLSFAFFWSDSYRRWSTLNDSNNPDLIHFFSGGAGFIDDLDSDVYVPRLKGDPVGLLSVKLIAFYLPQFHPIAENNLWWGEGFTEWTNVRPARPQFVGHYQPHIPGELGYYDLLEDKNIQRKQVELAKLYGVGGFCFYFYWFAGKTLLEKPIERYLNDPELDLPFCLCWANENWTRRWDGLDHDVLMAQRHSPQDDLAFIEHISRYMQDQRYIRIDGRPLLIVYRPSQLPDAKATVNRWRDWCAKSGIGEIYIACTQSFDVGDPDAYGMDAALEFPPINASPPDVTNEVEPLSDDFRCDVRDWRVFVARARNYKKPTYTLFRGVCPSWDNTARKKNKSTVLVNSSPCGYQEWLANAIEETRTRFTNADERLVFVNAWNEWAEGAHLEPDQRYGYAYLEATRMAMLRDELKQGHKSLGKSPKLAVVVHAFYVDIFREILRYLSRINRVFKLFVTTIAEHSEEVGALLRQSGFEYCLMMVDNLGRDILPFLRILHHVEEQGYQCILKLHTKKSPHRNDGALWRKELFDKLLNVENMSASLELLSGPDIGIVSPEGHLVRMNTYLGSNAEQVRKLSERMGVARESLQSMPFIAGSMFYVKLEALRPLLNLAITVDDFEAEDGQVDGTLAHAIERVFVISAWAGGYRAITQDGQMSATAQFAYA